MNETALVATNGNYGALAPYGDKDTVRELCGRIMSFHPAAKEVGEEGMMLAAQLAILTGASPIPGTNEIHIYMDKGKPKVERGYNYWARRAREAGGVRWIIQSRPMNKEERELYGIPNGVLAAVCKGMRATDYQQARREGMTFAQAENACGYIGIATATANEFAKNGRPPIWTPMKRAEVDFYRKAFPFIPGERANAGYGMVQGPDGYFRPANHMMGQGNPDYRTGGSLAQLNGDLFGDEVGPEWAGAAVAAGEDVLEGEFEEAATATTNPETGEMVPAVLPMDWAGHAENAEDLDVWASAVYQLTKEVATDAAQVKKGYVYLFGQFDPANNIITREVFRGYASAVADGAKKGEAATAAKVKFQEKLAERERQLAEMRAAIVTADDLFGEGEADSEEE